MTESVNVCEWCRADLSSVARADARTCSKSCRQALHRFRIGRAGPSVDRPMRFAYADPPYPGMARRYYDQAEIDQGALVSRLDREYPDGWALSTSAQALQLVLQSCPPEVRVAAWVRPARRGILSRFPIVAWEPLLVCRGRRILATDQPDSALVWRGRQPSHPAALVGMKPAPFCEWIFRLLGAAEGDSLDDLYPGSGAVARAWSLFVSGGSRTSLPSRLEESRASVVGDPCD